MKIEDFLEKPTYYAVKKDGILLTDFIISQDDLMLMEFYLLENHKVKIFCDNLECNCLQDAWEKHADGAEIVPVTIVETQEECGATTASVQTAQRHEGR